MEDRSSFIQFHVPLNRRSQWYHDLTASLDGVKSVKWQNGFFHITAAFVNDKIGFVEANRIAEILNEELLGITAPIIDFDTLDAFATQGGGTIVVYLTASCVSEQWEALIDRIRTRLKGSGYDLGPYRMHVTLARIPAGSIDLEELRHRISRIIIPRMAMSLTKADYRFFKEFKCAVREWEFPL